MLESPRNRDFRNSELKSRKLAQRKRSLRFSPNFQGLEDRPLLSTIIWNTMASPTGGKWDTGANWLGGVIPGSGDNAVINLSGAGTVTLSGSATDSVNSLTTNANTSIGISGETLSLATMSAIGGNLSLSSGVLTGAGTLSVAGLTTWAGGTMSGSGTTIAIGGLTIGGTGNVNYYESLSVRTLDNDGSATLTDNPADAGALGFSNGATFNNEAGASFAFDADVSITTSNGGGSFNNSGTFSKSAGTGQSIMESVLNDTGTGSVQAGSGTLNLQGGGSLGGTGAVSAASTLEFGTGTFTIGSSASITGSGTVDFAGGTVTDTGLYDITGVTEVTGSAATATLSGTLEALGPTLSVNGGTLNLTPTSPDGPYSLTTVMATNGGTVNFSTGAAISIGQFTITGGVLTGSDTVTVNGLTTWAGGTMSGSGTTIAIGGLTIGGTGNVNYYESLSVRTLDNDGSATLTDNPADAGALGFSNGATFNNEAGASFAFDADVSITTSNGGGSFNNSGTFSKSAGTGQSIMESVLNDTGTGSVQAGSGTLNLQGGGSLGGTGAVSAASTLEFGTGTFMIGSSASITGSGTVDFAGGTVTDTGLYDITGVTEVTGSAATATLSGTLEALGPTLSVNGGTLNLTPTSPDGPYSLTTVMATNGGTVNFSTGAAISIGQFTITGGVLTGSDTVTVNGLTTWAGGTMSGSGTTIAIGGLTIGGTGNVNYYESLSVRTLDNDGSATLTDNPADAGALGFSNGATFNNEAGASFAFDADVSITTSNGGGSFNNSGTATLSKSEGTGTSVIEATVSNSGTIQVSSGTLSLQGAFTNFSSTTSTLTGGTYLVGSTLQFASANIVTNAAAISLTGASAQFTDTGGHNALANLATNTAAGSLSIAGGPNITTVGAFSNAGSVTVGAGSTFTVTGAYTQSAGSTNLTGGGILTSKASTVSINGGVLAGTGTVNANVTNAGQVIPGGVGATGTLTILGTYIQSSGASMTVSLNGPTSQSGCGLLSVGGMATLAGTLYVDPSSNTLPNESATFQVLSYQSAIGQFATVTPQNFPSGWTFSTTYNPTNLVLTTNIPITLVSLAVTPTQASVAAGLTQQFDATAKYSDGSTEDVTDQVAWTSSDTTAATISNVGLAKAVAPGSTTITAALDGMSLSTTLNVTQATLTSIALSPSSPSVPLGKSEQFTATGQYTDGSKMVLTDQVDWMSSSTTVAIISNVAGSQGLAGTIGQGPTTITAALGGVIGSDLLTVTAPALVTINVTPSDPSFPQGSMNQSFTATGLDTDSSTQDLTNQVTWTSSAPAVASITSAGVVSALETGSTVITATDGAVSGSTTVTVVTPMVDFTVLGQALLGDFTTILANVNGVFQTAEAIPLIGQTLLNNAAISGDFSAFNDLIQALGTIATQPVNGANLVSSIENELFSALGPDGDGTLGALGGVTGGTLSPSDILVTPGTSAEGSFSIELLLTKTESTEVGFSLGLGKSLALSTGQNSITFSVTTDYLLDLTYSPITNTLNLVDTSLATQDSSLPATPLAFVVSAKPTAPTLGTAQFAGLMQATVTDNGSGLTADLGVGLDASLNPTVTLTTGTATVNIGLSLGFGSNVPLSPTIDTGLKFTLEFNNSSLDPSDASDFGTLSAPVTFTGVNVTLQLGIIGSIISDIQNVTEPLQPIINILNANIPGLDSLGIDVTLIGLLVGAAGGNTQEVETFFDDITLINSLHLTKSSTLTLSVLSSVVITDPRTGIPSVVSNSPVTNDDLSSALNTADGDLSQLDSGSQPLFTFPIFSDPVDTIIPLLLGTANANNAPDLFTFSLPTISIGTGISIPVGSIPPFVPVLLLDIGVNLSLAVSGGYDAYGLIEARAGNGRCRLGYHRRLLPG